MIDTKTNKLQYLIIIAEKNHKEKFLSLLSQHDAHSVEVMYGHGSMSPNAISEAFGFNAEQHKVLISCLIKNTAAQQLIDLLYNKHNFNKPNTGIAFTIPVEWLAF